MRVRPTFAMSAALVALCLSACVQAGPAAAKAALGSLVRVGLGRGNVLRPYTGTLLHAHNGEAIVFAVLPMQKRHDPFFLGAREAKVRFDTEGSDYLPVQELIWHNTEDWVLLRVKTPHLPSPPELREPKPKDTGAAVTVGRYAGLEGAPSIRVGMMTDFRKPKPTKEAVPFITLSEGDLGDSGAPVVDAEGKLLGCARFSPQVGKAAQVIPMMRIWEFMWQKLQPMEFSMARKEGKAWVMDCRLNLPLLTPVLGDAAVGIVPPLPPKQNDRENWPPPDTVWIPFEDKGGPFCLLPVAPSSVGRSTYHIVLRQKTSDGSVLYHGPVVVATNYQFDSPPKEPWLTPVGGK